MYLSGINLETQNYRNKQSFGNYTKNVLQDEFLVEQEYNDDNKLLKESFYNKDNDKKIRKQIEHDANAGKISKVENFNKDGLWLDTQYFEYSTGKEVETFNSPSMKYKRTITKLIKDSIEYLTEVYESSSNPENNYIYEITKNLQGKILTFLCNGKKVIWN